MEAVTILIAVAIVLVAVLFYKSRVKNYICEHVDRIPGPVKLPLVGTSLPLLLVPKEDLVRFSLQRFEEFGSPFRTWLGSLPLVHICKPEQIELVLNNSVQITKSTSYDALRPWLGDGLLTTTGNKWQHHRKLITPTFHFKILESFMEIFVEKSQLLVKHLESKKGEEVFDIYPYITHCALDIICETAMGLQMNSMSNDNVEYVNSVYGISEISLQRMLKPWLHPDVIFRNTRRGKRSAKYLKTLHDFTNKVIDERKRTLNEKQMKPKQSKEDVSIGKKERMVFLDLLIKESQNGLLLTDTEIREEVDTFMFEGHDTTTAGISWCLFLLGNHPDVQEEVFHELDSVFHGKDRPLTMNDLGEFRLLERCIKEALRLYPSVPIIARLLSEDLEIDNYLIPAGCTLNIHILLLHRDEEYFPNAERFDPDRFLSENLQDRHPYSYIPFSAGPRNCIGQKFAMLEEKTVLAYILRKFRVKSVQTQEDMRPVIELILRPLNGIQITLEPRTQ